MDVAVELVLVVLVFSHIVFVTVLVLVVLVVLVFFHIVFLTVPELLVSGFPTLRFAIVHFPQGYSMKLKLAE